MKKNLIRKEILNCDDEVQTRINEVEIEVSEIKKRVIRLDCECVTKYYEVNNEKNYEKFRNLIEDDSRILDVYDQLDSVKHLEIKDTYFDFYGTYINLNDVSLISIINLCDLMFDEIISRQIVDLINNELVYELLSVRP